jgi:Ca2+-transporting ATPase
VSKEASDIILLDDNFTTILGAIEEGRGIYDNIKKFVNFLLSTNFGEVLIIFFTSLMGMPIPLVAIQVLWVNLVTDGLPAIALGIDPIDKDIMKRKPLNANNIIDKTMMINIVAISLLMTISVVWFYVRWYHIDLVMARSGVLVLLVLLEMMRVQMIRSDYVIGIFSNKWLIAAFISSILLILLVIYTPLHIFFETTPLSSTMWIDLSIFFVVTTIVGIGISYFINHL